MANFHTRVVYIALMHMRQTMFRTQFVTRRNLFRDHCGEVTELHCFT